MAATLKEKIRLERADYPEQVGVSSKEMEALIADFKQNNMRFTVSWS